MGEVVQHQTGVEIIGAVQQQLCLGKEGFQLLWPGIQHMGVYGYLGIEEGQPLPGGDGLRQLRNGILLGIQHLSLQVASLYVIPVQDG
ncbi:hypothetical protein D3C73_1328820 [compost metagenome]